MDNRLWSEGMGHWLPTSHEHTPGSCSTSDVNVSSTLRVFGVAVHSNIVMILL